MGKKPVQCVTLEKSKKVAFQLVQERSSLGAQRLREGEGGSEREREETNGKDRGRH